MSSPFWGGAIFLKGSEFEKYNIKIFSIFTKSGTFKQMSISVREFIDNDNLKHIRLNALNCTRTCTRHAHLKFISLSALSRIR